MHQMSDHSGLLAGIEKLLKKQVVLTELAKLFRNAWIFTQADLEKLKSAMASPASS